LYQGGIMGKTKLIILLFLSLYVQTNAVFAQDVYFTPGLEASSKQVYFTTLPSSSATNVYFTRRISPNTINVYYHKGSLNNCDVTVTTDPDPSTDSIYVSPEATPYATEIFVSARPTSSTKDIHFSTYEDAEFILCVPNDPIFIMTEFSLDHIAAIVVLYFIENDG
jgi:hypothetical protein